MKLHCLNLAVGSTTASPNPTVKNFRQKGAASWSRDLFKNFKPPSIFFGMDEATFFKFSKWIDYGNSHPSSKNFPSKWAWSGS